MLALNLQKKNPDPNSQRYVDYMSGLVERNPHSMCLKDVKDTEILEVVHKTSTD